jgi:uridine kinase
MEYDLNQLAKKLPNSKIALPIKFISIDGHAGSGKSRFAKLLSEEMKCEVIHTDDFASWDHPLDWWPRLISEIFEPIKNGAQYLSYEKSTWVKESPIEKVENQSVTPIMLIEGVSSSRIEFRNYISFAVWVDTPLDVCFQRGIERDQKTGPNTSLDKSEIQKLWDEWLVDEQKYIERDSPQKYANLTIDGTASFESQLEAFLQAL